MADLIDEIMEEAAEDADDVLGVQEYLDAMQEIIESIDED